MKKLIFIILLLTTSQAFAGIPVCHDGSGKITFFSLSGNPKAGCLYFSDKDMAKYNEAKKLLKTNSRKYLKIVSGKLVELTAQEKIDLAIANTAAQKSIERTRIETFESSDKDKFIAFLKLYNKKVTSSMRISKSEIISQIKLNKGL